MEDIILAAIPQLIALAGQLTQQAVQSGSITQEQADALWASANLSWNTDWAAWQAQQAAKTAPTS